jgi:hypothetical protein
MRMFQKVAVVLAGVFAVMGGALVAGGTYGTGLVRDQLAVQEISFAPAGSPGLPANLQAYGGKQVLNGADAKVFAGYIDGHVLAATGGLTYSEISAKARANPEDATLAAARRTALDGQMLRSSLLNAWGWWLLATIMFWIGIGALALAVAAGAVAAAAPVRERARGWRAAHHGTAIAH